MTLKDEVLMAKKLSNLPREVSDIILSDKDEPENYSDIVSKVNGLTKEYSVLRTQYYNLQSVLSKNINRKTVIPDFDFSKCNELNTFLLNFYYFAIRNSPKMIQEEYSLLKVNMGYNLLFVELEKLEDFNSKLEKLL